MTVIVHAGQRTEAIGWFRCERGHAKKLWYGDHVRACGCGSREWTRVDTNLFHAEPQDRWARA